MSKGETTRKMILERSAPLFNQQGYFGVSLSDIMHATELEKGGIYNHFASKEQLALASFDYAWGLVQQHARAALAKKKHAADRLRISAQIFLDLADGSLLPGGCPILNTAIEADDAFPSLRERACGAMDFWRATLQHIINKGIEREELRPGTDAEAFSTLFISSLEGAVMLSKLYNDMRYIRQVIGHVNILIDGIALPAPESFSHRESPSNEQK
jgi:TetR/AcrR family transcriptional regulator, transcriptional repressor for nem operon